MTKEIQALSEELEKMLTRISEESESTLVNLSGNLKDIDSGTLIKIPMAAGYVKFYRSAENWRLCVWIDNTLTETI